MRGTATLFRAGMVILAMSIALLARPNLLTPSTAASSPLAAAEPQSSGETNLALGKSATQSSTGWDSPASLAIDGNTDGDWSHGSVSHTAGDPQGWWQVDLGSVQQVGRVEVYLMTVCCSSHEKFDVKISTDGANWQSTYVPGPVDYVSVPVNLQARYVRVQLRDTDYLALAEVQIFGPSSQPRAAQAANTSPHALSLNGTDSYVSVPFAGSLNITGPLTVEAWVKRNPGTNQAIVERYGASSGGYALRIEGDKLVFYTLNNSSDYHRLVSNSAVTAGAWHHVAGVFDGSQKQIFIDGLLDTSAATTYGPGSGTATLRIGVAGGGNVYFFSGLIDEVRVTAGVRYASSFLPDLSQAADGSDTRGLWNFDTQTANDSSGKDNHGTFYGGMSCSSLSPAGEQYSSWKAARDQAEVAAQPADQPIKIDFDNFSHGTTITNQYPPATFSSGPGQLPVTYNPLTNSTEGAVPFSRPNLLTRFNNFPPFFYDHFAPLTVDFARPINNLRFGVIGVDALAGRSIFLLDIYQNGTYKATWNIASLGGGVNMTVNVGQPSNQFGFNEVTKIVIRNIPQLETGGLGFDDFTFSVPETLKVDITNPRVSGNLHNSVKPALLGADVKLQAAANRTGGTYTWTVAGPHQRVLTSTNPPAIVERWIEPGTYRVTVNYSLNGETASAFVDVNVVAPTLSSFSAERTTDRIVGDNDSMCLGQGPSFGTVRYVFGCPRLVAGEPSQPGIAWTATAQIAPVQYLSDPAQSGIKIVQILSTLRKGMVFGSVVCDTTRSSESDIQSGWQLDTTDPYDDTETTSVKRFSDNATLALRDSDSPSSLLRYMKSTEQFNFALMDALSVDLYFETYVVYFTGDSGRNTAPSFQRAIGFVNPNNNPNMQVAYIPWTWSGKVFFDPEPQFFSPCKQYKDKHCLQSSTPTTNPVNAVSKACLPGSRNCLTPYVGNVALVPGFVKCPGGPDVSNSMIDTPRYFVWRHYKDFFNRDPLDPAHPDEVGLDYWRGEITQCGFDFSCIDRKRVDVARAFFYSDEFINKVPLLANGTRCTVTYNKEFVRQCYFKYLQRPGDPEVDDPVGFIYWVSKLNNQCPTMGDGAYNEMLRAFILSTEYRNRFPAPPPLPW